MSKIRKTEKPEDCTCCGKWERMIMRIEYGPTVIHICFKCLLKEIVRAQ